MFLRIFLLTWASGICFFLGSRLVATWMAAIIIHFIIAIVSILWLRLESWTKVFGLWQRKFPRRYVKTILEVASDMVHPFIPSLEEHTTESALSGPFGVDGKPARGSDLARIDDRMLSAKMGDETILPSIRCT